MKAKFLALAALVLGLASCQQEPELFNPVGGEVDVQLTVDASSIGTRADSDGDDQNGHDSAYGAIDYLEADWAAYDLRYTLEVYDASAANDANAKPIKARQQVVMEEYAPASFDLRLVPGRAYRFVVFADILKEDGTAYHVIGETLRNITITNDGINNEATDAYFDFKDVTVNDSTPLNMTLTRPYGKLRVVATDLAELNLNIDVKAVEVTYTATHPTTFNAVTGEIGAYTENVSQVFTSEISEGSHYTAGYDDSPAYMTLFTDYILARAEGQDNVQFTLNVYDDEAMADVNLIKSTTFNTTIPVERNHLTTVIGNVLTTATEINVTIDDKFAGETTVTAAFDEELAAAATQKNAVIELTGDIYWETGASHGSTPWIPADAITETLTINANGHRIIAQGAGVGPIRMANGGKLIINNAVIVDESVSYNEGAWELGYLEFAGNLEFNNCQFVNAVMMCGGTANNNTACEVTFNECRFNSNKTKEYAVWVSGSKAYFNNSIFEGPRGLKIHEAYGSEVAEVVVDGCTFQNIAEKPGIAIGTVDAATKIEVKNSTFVNCQAGDQVLYIYETDTDVASFDFVLSNNTIGATVSTQAELESFLGFNVETIEVSLAADVDLNASNAYLKLGGANTKRIIIDGTKVSTAAATGATTGNYTLNLATTYWSRLNTVNPDAVIELRNLNLTSSQLTGTWNSYDVTFQCNVDLKNVNLLKAVAFDGEGKTVNVENVTITETHDYYAMWISAVGQTVNIKNLVVNATEGRGIKIDEQYVGTPALVTLNIENAKFATLKKAAIIVKSEAGAVINASNLDISEVAADSTFAVWVDEDAAGYANEVEVNGALVKVEGATTQEAATQEALNTAIASAAVIEVKAGTYTFPTGVKAGQTILCEEGTVFTGNTKLNINGATVAGATFSNPSGSAVGSTINGVFKNCTFTGSNAVRGAYAGETCVFEDCVFSGDVYGFHFDGGANDATFRRCVFSGFNAFGAAVTMITFEDCTFVGNGKSGYNGANLWGSAVLKNCEFTFDGTTANEWIDCIGADKTYSFENCTINGVDYTAENYTEYGDIFSRNHVTVEINGVDCAM